MVVGTGQAFCSSVGAVPLNGSLDVHDPSRIIKQGNRYYTFATGGSSSSPINMKYSDNFTTWNAGPGSAIFSSIPAWAYAEVTDAGAVGQPGNMWAPDVIYFNNEYRLYYSVSTFGSRNSVIGLATNTTLDFNDPNYAWVDKQMVIESEVNPFSTYPWNAIDPAIFYDDSTSRMWMAYGSYSNGLYVTELDPATGKRITPNSPTTLVARRSSGVHGAVEASYLLKHDDYYYLFVAWDGCCVGVNSTYNIRVGRGTSPTGPFLDKAGVSMFVGGGTLFQGTEGSVIGPGHFSSFSENGHDYYSYHYYDGTNGGIARLGIEEFLWTQDGWPVRAADFPQGDYNLNGVVDAADYTIWRDTLGSTTDLRANGNNIRNSIGVIDMADYELWRFNYGRTSGAGAASGLGSAETVPEPATFLLAAIAASTLVVRRRTSS